MLTVVTEKAVYRYFKENEIEFIKNQLDDRPWIRLPMTVTNDENGVAYQQDTLIPRSRIIKIVQMDKIIKS